VSTPNIPDPKDPLYLCDDKGNVFAVQLSIETWKAIEAQVMPLLAQAGAAAEAEKPLEETLPPEPMADWNMLTDYWGFAYPVDYSVHCDECGSHTEDWTKDEPRKFWLKAANLGGLVSYLCLECQARVTKKFFKDKFTFEATPFQEKDPRKNAYYGDSKG
jgi:hypothetical protein